MKRRVIRVVAIVLVLAGTGFGIWVWQGRRGRPSSNELTIHGNTDMRQVQLAFNNSERIVRILVEEGDLVEEGQLLAVLDTSRMKSALAEAEGQAEAQSQVLAAMVAGTRPEEIRKLRAEVEAATVQAANAERNYKRLAPLAHGNLAPKQEVDDAGAGAEAARARLHAARESLALAVAGPRREDTEAAKARLRALEARRDLARQRLEDASLYAPLAGVIRNRILEVGDMASPQRPVFTLALTNPVWMRGYIVEPDLGKIWPGMKAEVTTDSYPGKRYPGWIGYISPTAEFTPKWVQVPEVRTHLVYQVRVYVCNPENELRLGMPATATVRLDQLRVPASGPGRCKGEG